MKEQVTCAVCGKTLAEEAAVSFDGKLLCPHCYEESTVICHGCGERIWQDNDQGDEHIRLCGNCYEYSYTACTECGRLIPIADANYADDDSGNPYCDECFSTLDKAPIHSYDYKPVPIFYGSDNLYYGVELEIDKGGELDSHADMLLGVAKSERIYCKHDGSIDDGFEIVSHPMSLEYHSSGMNWQDVFSKAAQMGYRSHNTNTCGLHVHVNRVAFGGTYEKQEAVIARIVYFVENHWNELVKFSRRTEGNLNHWASRYGISTTAKDTYKNAKDKRLGRYVAVNLENYATIEFRLFRGTLRYKTFLATLQMVDEICRLAIMLEDKAFESMSWSSFVSNISTSSKPELIEYLKSKRLYVNELTEESEEM